MMDINILKQVSKNLKILLVEDEEALRKGLTKTLKRLFKQVDEAENGEVGLQMFKNNSYDLLITDIKMPKMDGIEFSQKVKIINADFPIIVLSAYNEASYLLKLINLGVEGFVEKPPTDRFFYTLFKIVRNIDSLKEKEILNQKLKILNENLNIKNRELTKKNLQLNRLYKDLESRFEKEVEGMLSCENLFINNELTKDSIENKIFKNDIQIKIKTSAKEYLKSIDFFKYNKDILEDLQISREFEEELIELINATAEVNENFIEKIKYVLMKYSNIFRLLVEFVNIANALEVLINALELIDYEKINENTSLFLKYLEGLIVDFKEWRDSIFINQDAIDIHYLDDSLLNDVLTIQSFITDDEEEDDEDDILMF